MRDYELSDESIVKKLKQKLEPRLLKIIKDAPEWGTVSLSVVFNAKIAKRLEISINESIQLDDEK